MTDLAQQIDALFKLPGHLCKQRGICCRVATFKGSLPYEGIQALARGEGEAAQEPALQEMAQDFVSLFTPYPSQADVRALANEFVNRVREKAQEKGKDPDAITFFHCRYVLADGRCGVHEDRPTGCRSYPLPHPSSIFHPGCGYEAQAKENLAQLTALLEPLGIKL